MSDLNQDLVVIATTPYDMVTTEFKSALDRRQSNRQALIEWIKKGLVSGTDYGSIHIVGRSKCGLGNKCTNPSHFSKLVMFKPGSEKICAMFSVTPRFPNLPEYERAALQGVEIRYAILHCELHNSAGVVLADGVGARSLVQDGGDLNKCLKMCAKSAMIDATLRLGGLSELFTQDLEDAPPKDDDTGEPVYLANATQLKKTYARMKGYDLPEARVAKWCKAKFGVEKIEELTHDQWLVLDEKLEAFAETVKSERNREPISADQLRKVVSFALQHSVDLNDALRKIGINNFGELTGANVDALWKALECKAERKAIQGESSQSPVIQVPPGSEAEKLLDAARQIRTQAKYSDGQSYYADLERAQTMEAAARRLMKEEVTQ